MGDQTQELFLLFRNEAMECRSVFETHNRLFAGSEADKELLREVAPVFFQKLANWLADLHALLAGRLTDPACSGPKKRPNLSCRGIIEQMRSAHPDLPSELEDVAGRLDCYREKIKDWRDKRIAHLDQKVLTGSLGLGSGPIDFRIAA